MEDIGPIRYFDRDFRIEAVKILPGQYYAAAGQGAITTVLGSCVATCLWDPLARIGGMNHFMLPGDGDTGASVAKPSARFGVYAMEVLINEMIHIGADSLDVGAKNSQFVLEFLATEAIPVLAQDLLGSCARKVNFFPETGKVQLKQLHILPNDTVQLREREYLSRLDPNARGGEVEIFRRPR
jgi:chemotaxis protein CheD